MHRVDEPAARTNLYTPEIAAAICTDIAIGHTVAQAAGNAGIDPNTIYAWRLQHADFGEIFARAKAAQMDYFAEEIIEIADDGLNDWMQREARNGSITVLNDEHVQRSRLRIDTRKWLMARMAPRRYGDRVALTDGSDDPLARYRAMTDEQRLQEARALLEEAYRVLERAKAEGMTIEGEAEAITE